MASTCRLFSFSGLMSAPIASGSKGFTSDAVQLLKYPYAAREAIVANDSAQSSASALAPDGVELLLCQVQAGKAIHFEINSPNRTTEADTSSPILTGDAIIKWGRNWTISILEAEVV